ncbi:MAG: hypothetical protein INR62_05565, partial [Rhodospirillales bacterium]|nr:hypothetical protein [Acetobacter sp.]
MDQMSEAVIPSGSGLVSGTVHKPDLDHKLHPSTLPVFLLLLVSGLGYAVYGLLS